MSTPPITSTSGMTPSALGGSAAGNGLGGSSAVLFNVDRSSPPQFTTPGQTFDVVDTKSGFSGFGTPSGASNGSSTFRTLGGSEPLLDKTAAVTSTPDSQVAAQAASLRGRSLGEIASFAATAIGNGRPPATSARNLVLIKEATGVTDDRAASLIAGAFNVAGLSRADRGAIIAQIPNAQTWASTAVAGALRSVGPSASADQAALAAATVLAPLGFGAGERSRILDRAFLAVPGLPADTKRQAAALIDRATPDTAGSEVGRILGTITAAVSQQPSLADAAKVLQGATTVYQTVESLLGVLGPNDTPGGQARPAAADRLAQSLQSLQRQGLLTPEIATGGAAAIRIYGAAQNLIGFVLGQKSQPGDLTAGDKFLNNVIQLRDLGVLTDDVTKVILSAGGVYKTVQNTINAIGGQEGAALKAVDGLNSVIAQILPPAEAAKMTGMVTGLKDGYRLVQNLTQGLSGRPGGTEAWTKAGGAAASLLTNSQVFGTGFSKTAGTAVTAYNLGQNVVNMLGREEGAGRKALDAGVSLASLISPEAGQIVKTAGLTYQLGQNVVGAINGQKGAVDKALMAGQGLAQLPILPEGVRTAVNTGINAYKAVDAVVKLVQAPSLASGFGAVGAVANLIGGKTAGTIANIATLGLGIATGGIGAIIGGAVGLLGGLFGSGKQYTTISKDLDVSGDGKADKIRFETKNDDWEYQVDAATLNVDQARFRITATFPDGTAAPVAASKASTSAAPTSSGATAAQQFGLPPELNVGDRIGAGVELKRGQYLSSNDGRFVARFQDDGNFVVYQGTKALWASKTRSKGGERLVMQADGNLVMYKADGKAIWSSKSKGGPGQLIMQNDGNLVAYREGGKAIWASKTKATVEQPAVDMSQEGSTRIGALLKDEDGRPYILRDSGEGHWHDYQAGDEAVRSGRVPGQNATGPITYKLKIDYSFQRINDAPSLKMKGQTREIELTKEQYDKLVARMGGTEGSIGGADGRLAALRELAAPSGTLKLIQEKKNQGMTYYIDMNGDAILDRVTKYMLVKGKGEKHTDGDDTSFVELRNKSGQSWMTYALDKEGAFTDKGRAADRVRSSVGAAASWIEVGGQRMYGMVDAKRAPISRDQEAELLAYVASYPELMRDIGTDLERAREHMTTHGVAEGRSVSFDAGAYLAANPDVAQSAAGDPGAAARHYILHGAKEGRALRVVTDDVNGDKVSDVSRIFKDRVESTYRNGFGIETTAVYNRSGALVSARGDYDNDGQADQAVVQADGTVRVTTQTPAGGDVAPVRVLGADGTLLAVEADLTGDGRVDHGHFDAKTNTWTVKLAGTGQPMQGTAATLEGALANAALQDPGLQAAVLGYVASSAERIATFGTDVASAYQDMVKQGAGAGPIMFDAEAYLSANPDLISTIGSDPLAAVRQYITTGFKEGRALQVAIADVNEDGLSDVVELRPNQTLIGLGDGLGQIARIVEAPTLAEAVALASRPAAR